MNIVAIAISLIILLSNYREKQLYKLTSREKKMLKTSSRLSLALLLVAVMSFFKR